MIILITIGLSLTLFGLDSASVMEMQEPDSSFPFVLVAGLIYIFCILLVAGIIKRKTNNKPSKRNNTKSSLD